MPATKLCLQECSFSCSSTLSQSSAAANHSSFNALLQLLHDPEALRAYAMRWGTRSQAGQGEAIPELLHQSWKSCRLPTVAEAWRDQTAVTLQSSWRMWLWTDHDNRAFIEREFPAFIPLFDRMDVPIKRIDAVRYLYLFKYGGVYMDLDSMSLRPFEELPLTRGEAIFGYIHDNLKCPDGACIPLKSEAVPNAFMAAPPGHPFFAFLMHRLNHTAHKARVLEATGPIFLSSALRRWASLRFGGVTIHSTPRLFNTVSNLMASVFHPCGIGARNPVNEKRRTDLAKCTQKLPHSVTTTFWASSWAKFNGTIKGKNVFSPMDWCGRGGRERCEA